MKFTEEENNELRAAAEEILAVPGAEEALLEIIKRESPGWRKMMGITPRMIKVMEKEIAQTGRSSQN